MAIYNLNNSGVIINYSCFYTKILNLIKIGLKQESR